MDQILHHSRIDAGAEGPVKMGFIPEAPVADILGKISAFKVSPAAVTEGRRILFDLSPACCADKVVGRSSGQSALAGKANLRIDDICQALEKTAQHSHIITIKSKFVNLSKMFKIDTVWLR
jgi:hypothetical protein